jgi:integrase
MLTVRKRGEIFHVDLMAGKIHVVRGSLGTRNADAARRVAHRLETALAEGPLSPVWIEIERLMPPESFARFANFAGVKHQHIPTWGELHESFEVFMEQRIKMDKLRPSTAERYRHTLREFDLFLKEQEASLLQDVNVLLVERFKVWRIDRTKKRENSRAAAGVVLDAAILHRVFSFALTREMIAKNPVQLEGRPGDNPEGGSEPYNAEELGRMREHSGEDLLAFLVLLRTGLRGSDAVTLTWREVDLRGREIVRVTQKRRKKVVPIHAELQFALETERDRRNPSPTDRVLLNPATGKPLTRPRLYQRIQGLGRRSNVAGARPHRFRDTLAVDMLARGLSPYDVAKTLGDTIDTIERHYTPFVKELRDRVRWSFDHGAGLEEMALDTAGGTFTVEKKPN